MINEEIIEALKFIKCSYLGRNDTWEAKKLDKAIEALRQGSCDDAVSRQVILDCKYAISDDEIGERKYVVDVTDIVELPPVTPSRPKGHWEFDEKGYFSCSECKRKPKDQTATTDFCPNCGADIRG